MYISFLFLRLRLRGEGMGWTGCILGNGQIPLHTFGVLWGWATFSFFILHRGKGLYRAAGFGMALNSGSAVQADKQYFYELNVYSNNRLD